MTQGTDIQVAMFSATFPKEVRGLAEKYLQKYIYVGIGSEGKSGSVSKSIQQVLVDVRQGIKNQVLFEQIKNLEGKILSKFYFKGKFLITINSLLRYQESRGQCIYLP